MQNPGRRHAPRERVGLFDIVRWELPKTVRRRAASSAVLILRSAHALAVPQSRKGVRASRRMRTVALMLRDASQRIWAMEAPALAFGCDAPQHEGDGARRVLAKRSHVEEPTCGCGKRSLVRLACFRPVIYREPRNFNVSGGSRALRRASLGGVASRAVRCHGGAQGPRTQATSTSRWPAYRREAIMHGLRSGTRRVLQPGGEHGDERSKDEAARGGRAADAS